MMKSGKSDQGIDLNDELESSISCSICFDLVNHGGERSTAKLQCGHEFHLDCIGSAFNMKGMMQCPNCRNIEKGQWLCPSGPMNSAQEISVDDAAIDHYSFYFNFAEMPYRVHVCPFRGMMQVHPSLESNIGLMSISTPLITHQHPGSRPHPHGHGWIPFQHAPYHHQQSTGPLMPITGGAGRFDNPRSMPRFVSPGRMYDPHSTFSLHLENPHSNYLHAWSRDNLHHFP